MFPMSEQKFRCVPRCGSGHMLKKAPQVQNMRAIVSSKAPAAGPSTPTPTHHAQPTSPYADDSQAAWAAEEQQVGHQSAAKTALTNP